MPTKAVFQKIECHNPNTGGRMNIAEKTYDIFSKAIYHTLKKHQPLLTPRLLKELLIVSGNKNQNLMVQLAGMQ